MGYRRRKPAPRGPSPEAIQAVPKWVIAPGGIGHAVRSHRPGGKPATVAVCGKDNFMGGAFTPHTPKRICRECAAALGVRGRIGDPKPPPVPETQGNLFD